MIKLIAEQVVSEEEAKKVWKSLDRKINSVTIHFEGGASMLMSLSTFKKMANLDRKD